MSDEGDRDPTQLLWWVLYDTVEELAMAGVTYEEIEKKAALAFVEARKDYLEQRVKFPEAK